MAISSQLAVSTHKAYRLRDAIKQLEAEVQTDPSRQPALDSFRELLTKLELYDDKFTGVNHGAQKEKQSE